MKHSMMTRLLSMVLAVVMLMGLVPATIFAAEADGQTDVTAAARTATSTGVPTDMTVVSDKQSTLAPGITQRKIVVYDKNGDQVSMFVAVADLSVDTVGVYANYKDNQNDVLGMSKTTEQVAAAEAKHEEPYSVVVAINASYYNMTTGKPTGTFVMEGNDITTESEGNAYSFFAILKDGTPIIGARGEYSSYKGQIAEAVGGYHHIVKDGAVYTDGGRWSVTDTKKYPRQTVGITADNQVIIMSADGNQAPKSIGLTMLEQAEVMLALGCVEAVHLDGGGSMTYCAKPEGANAIQILNSPSDGSERSVSNSLMFVSTAAPDGAFDHATLTAENEFVTPGSTVSISAIGVDAAGGSAEVPEDISWKMADNTMGSVSNGVFTSSGTAGDAVVQMIYNDKVVGEVTIHVVIPETLEFSSSQITVPYGKTVDLGLAAYYGVAEVATKPSDIIFTLSDNTAGTIDGFNFTACAEEVGASGTNISAVLSFDNNVKAETAITLGRGSQVIFDFEDGETGDLLFSEPAGTKYNYVWPESSQWVVTEENGKVHSGDYAMAAKVNYGNSLESGYMKTSLVAPTAAMFENATQVGLWLYIPDEAVGLWARWTILTVTGKNEDGTPIFGSGINGNILDGATGGTGSTYQFDESGWHYLSIDTSKYGAVGWKAGQAIMQFYICDRDGAAFDYYFAEHHNINGEYTFYMDDITVDYSSAVDDRDAPVISSVTYANVTMADAVELNGHTSNNNTLTFAATVADKAASNATGLDASTAKAYIDGNPVDITYSNGKISTDNIVLADGVHTVKFSICDKQGNYNSEIRTIVVDADSEMSTIKVVPHDATLNRILLGSVYYVDVVATDVENVESVVTTMDLDNMSVWHLDHMEVADGFEASYTIDDAENIATITITRTGDVTATGEAALVSIPVRTWELKMGYTYPNGTKQGSAAMTYKQFYSGNEFWPIYIDIEVDCGLATFADGTTGMFSGEGVLVPTEMWANYGNMIATAEGKAYHAAWNAGHIHTAEAIADLAATCTEDGYTGRTFCAVCNSVVDWGTKIPATGHTYELVDGVLKCECGELYNGIYEDVAYVDGVACEGWIGESYYVAGKKLTGVQKAAAPDASGEFYYDFGEDGVCANQVKYTGLFHDASTGLYHYSKIGELAAGWFMIDDEWYYFHSSNMAAKAGNYRVGDVYFDFDETGRIASGVWARSLQGMRYYYGPTYHKTGWQTIDGERYYFENGCRYEGYRCVHESNSQVLGWYDFGTDGICRPIPDGLHEDNNGLYYVINGEGQRGLWQIDGDYYFFSYDGYAATGSVYAYETHCDLKCDTYYFGDDCKMVNGIVVNADGVYYYQNGKPGTSGLTKIGDDYYFVGSGGKCATGVKYAWATNCDLKCDTYEFGADGKMLNGIVEKADGVYYYENGKPAGTSVGLTKIGDDYYFIGEDGKCATGSKYAWATNCDLKCDTYEFGADGKMLNGIVMKEDGPYYYQNGKGGTDVVGLNKIGDDYYFITYGGKCSVGSKYAWATNCDLKCDTYEFGADGKMLNGIVEKEDGVYLYEDGKAGRYTVGLTKIGDDYYFVCTGGVCATGVKYAWQTNCDLKCDTYEFGADGKMLQGIVEKENGVYLYEDGKAGRYTVGLTKIGDDYYFVGSGGLCATGVKYAWATNCDLKCDTYEFGADGKMLNGIVEKADGIYYYANGKIDGGNAGLTKIGDDYYFVGSDGRVATGSKYAWATNCDLKCDTYEFGADGKMLQGFVTKADGIYYYVNGKPGTVGLNYIDGHYYFVTYSGRLITNQAYYAWETNGLLIETTYTFNELGQIVG